MVEKRKVKGGQGSIEPDRTMPVGSQPQSRYQAAEARKQIGYPVFKLSHEGGR
jgi:hypothetical protein